MSILFNAAKRWSSTVPEVWECRHLSEPGLQALFFANEPFHGKPTRCFAWLGLPDGADAARPVPGVVLVHGGGGTAFARWVRWWNQRGYAAIAMDTCGGMPIPETGATGSLAWPRHSFSGPPGWGGLNQGNDAPEEHWVFHACAAIVRAHSLLRAMPEVDAARIGVTGISWGGFLTCLAAGIDSRFRCAAPVYGCGFVSEESTWVDNGEFDRLSPEQRRFWRENWDPAEVLPSAACPMLWLNGTNDFAYWPPSWQRSAAATNGPRQLCLKLRWPHGHIAEAEETAEIAAFFDAHLAGGIPMLTISSPAVAGKTVSAEFGTERPLRSASLLVTVDRGTWPTRQWHTLPAQVDMRNRRVSAEMPAGTTAACLSLLSEDWLYTTSDIVFPIPGLRGGEPAV
jgi:dienelactone hydrolase